MKKSSELYLQTCIFCDEKTLEHFIIHACENSAEVSTIISNTTFLYCYVVYSKTSAGYRDKLQVAFNSSAKYVYGVSRRGV
jgi:hypothetical protein